LQHNCSRIALLCLSSSSLLCFIAFLSLYIVLIDVLIYSAARVLNKLTYLLSYFTYCRMVVKQKQIIIVTIVHHNVHTELLVHVSTCSQI